MGETKEKLKLEKAKDKDVPCVRAFLTSMHRKPLTERGK